MDGTSFSIFECSIEHRRDEYGLELFEQFVEEAGADAAIAEEGTFDSLKKILKPFYRFAPKHLKTRIASALEQDSLFEMFEYFSGLSNQWQDHDNETTSASSGLKSRPSFTKARTDRLAKRQIMRDHVRRFLCRMDCRDFPIIAHCVGMVLLNQDNTGHEKRVGKMLDLLPVLFRIKPALNEGGITLLHIASLKKSAVGEVDKLLHDGMNVNAMTSNNLTPLHLASFMGHHQIAERLILGQAVVDAKMALSITPLHLACLYGNRKIIEILISNGANINSKMVSGFSPLHAATLIGNLDAIKQLKSAGADLNAKANGEITPLYIANVLGRVEILKYLVDFGADVNVRYLDDYTILHLTSWYNFANSSLVTHYLADKCTDINVRDKVNLTPLHMSAAGLFDTSKDTKALLSAGADVDAVDEFGCRPVHLAAFMGKLGTLRELLAHNADVNCTTNTGYLPVDFAAMSGFMDAVCLLLENGTVIATTDQISRMQIAVIESSKEMNVLFRDEISVNTVGQFKTTALHLATSLGRLNRVIELLSFADISVNQTDSIGRIPIHYAAEIGDEDIVNALSEKMSESDLQARDEYGMTVLHLATIFGHSKLIKYFMGKGLNPLQCDKAEKNCLDYAVLYRQEAAIKTLLAADCGKNFNVPEEGRKRPIEYLHPSEIQYGMMAMLILGESEDKIKTISIESLPSLPDISRSPPLSMISKTPYIGSVKSLPNFNLEAFVEIVKNIIQDIVDEAIPTGKNLVVLGSGSSFEGTKNGLPDEFDFTVKLYRDDTQVKNEFEGYVAIKSESRELEKLGMVGSIGIWFWDKMSSYWVDPKRSRVLTDKNNKHKFEMNLGPQRHPDHRTCTNWVWMYSSTDGEFYDIPVSIDLVPSIEREMDAKAARSTWKMDQEAMRKGVYYLVPKMPHDDTHFESAQRDLIGRKSFHPLEVEHLQDLEERVKDVYVTAKCVRKPEVCGIMICNRKGDVVAVIDYVTSYMLKTVFLHMVELFLRANMSLGKMVLMVYDWLDKCLTSRKLPIFFCPDIDVLAGCKDSYIEDAILVCRALKSFVHALYEREYSTEQREMDDREEKEAIEMMASRFRDYSVKKEKYDREWRDYEKKYDYYLNVDESFLQGKIACFFMTIPDKPSIENPVLPIYIELPKEMPISTVGCYNRCCNLL